MLGIACAGEPEPRARPEASGRTGHAVLAAAFWSRINDAKSDNAEVTQRADGNNFGAYMSSTPVTIHPVSLWRLLALQKGVYLAGCPRDHAILCAVESECKQCFQLELLRPEPGVEPGDHRVDVVDRQADRLPQRRRVGRHVGAFE